MKKYDVSGMSCAACSARVEKAVSDVEGVTSCTVNLLTNYDYWTPMVSSKFIENNIIQIEGSPFFADNCPDILYDYTYNLETKEIVEFNYEIIKHE